MISESDDDSVTSCDEFGDPEWEHELSSEESDQEESNALSNSQFSDPEVGSDDEDTAEAIGIGSMRNGYCSPPNH